MTDPARPSAIRPHTDDKDGDHARRAGAPEMARQALGGLSAERRRADEAQAPSADYLGQDAARFFYRWGGLFSSTLIRIRARFDCDLDQYLLYLIFLLAELSQVVSRADIEARGGQPSPWTRRGMNALSLAEITRIPRETARRKLQILAERGYLTRSDDGLYHLGDQYGLDAFFADLSPLFWDAVKTGPRP